jgi:methionyl-tRNA formyltransferase
MIKRIVFMGTPDFATPALKALADRYEIAAVYTQPDKPVGRGLQLAASPVKLEAQARGIPVHQPLKLSAPGEYEKLAELKPDALVVVAYGQILKSNVLSLPRLGCINIHSSLLPRWRGAAPIHWALLSGDAETGVTTMRMDAGLDTGDMLLQSNTAIAETDTLQSLHNRLALQGAELIIKTIEGLDSGTLKPTPQESAGVTYAVKITKEMGFLNPQAEDAHALARRVRTLNPWPGTWITLQGQGRLKIIAAQVRADVQGPVESQIFERSGMVLLSSRSGCLELQRLQWEGKSPIGPVEFLNGIKGRGQTLPLRLESKTE